MQGDLQRTAGRNFRAHRKARGLSQEGLGDLLGIHRTYVGAIERGECNLRLQTLERLASGLGVDPAALLTEPSDGGDAPRCEEHRSNDPPRDDAVGPSGTAA